MLEPTTPCLLKVGLYSFPLELQLYKNVPNIFLFFLCRHTSYLCVDKYLMPSLTTDGGGSRTSVECTVIFLVLLFFSKEIEMELL